MRLKKKMAYILNHVQNRMDVKIAGHSSHQSSHKDSRTIKSSVTCYTVDKSNGIKRFKKEGVFQTGENNV